MLNKKLKIWVFIAVLCITTFFVQESSADCCRDSALVAFSDPENRYGTHQAYVCLDGTWLKNGRDCGVGKCNIFGCNCEGGCRYNSDNNSWTEARRLFEEGFDVKVIWLEPL